MSKKSEIYIDNYGWKNNYNSSSWFSLQLEKNSELFFISIESNFTNVEKRNALLEKSLVISFIVFFSFVPKKAMAQTFLKDNLKETITCYENVERNKTAVIEKIIKPVIRPLGRRLGTLNEMFHNDILLNIYQNEIILPKVIHQPVRKRIIKETFYEIIEISKPLIIPVNHSVVYKKQNLISTFFSNTFALSLNLFFQKSYMLKTFMNVPSWLPLPFGTRTVISAVNTLKRIYLSKTGNVDEKDNKNRNKSADNDSNEFAFDILNFLDNPKKQKQKQILGLSSLDPSGFLKILALILGLFYLKNTKSESVSSLMEKVKVFNGGKLTRYERITRSIKNIKPQTILIFASAGCVIYVYINRDSLFKGGNSTFSLAFRFMEKQMNTSIKVLTESSNFVQNLTLSSLKKLDAVTENNLAEIITLKVKVENLETERLVLVEKHHTADKALSVNQIELKNCENQLLQTEQQQMQIQMDTEALFTNIFPNNNVKISTLEAIDSSSRSFDEILLNSDQKLELVNYFRAQYFKNSKKKFPVGLIGKSSLSGETIKKDSHLIESIQEIAKEVFLNLGNTRYI